MNREQLLTMIRRDERDALEHLSDPPEPDCMARTLVPLTRQMYALIDKPPSRHQWFAVSTLWRPVSTGVWQPRTHAVFAVRTRHAAVCVPSLRNVKLVRDYQPGLFGGPA